MGLDFSVVPAFAGVLLTGALWTIAITLSAAVLSFFGGIVFAVIALYAPLVIRYPFRLFAWLFMGTPLLLQLFLIYFGLIQIGIDLPAFVAGVIGLGLHFAVYNSDIIQAGIRQLVTLPPDLDDPVWGASFGPSLTMLQEAGVQLHLSRRDAAQAQADTMRAP